jgi:hypothetical protein
LNFLSTRIVSTGFLTQKGALRVADKRESLDGDGVDLGDAALDGKPVFYVLAIHCLSPSRVTSCTLWRVISDLKGHIDSSGDGVIASQPICGIPGQVNTKVGWS